MMARRVIAGVDRFTPKALFANGEQGVWYDPSDFSTMFQDTGGTIPVTGVDQYIGARNQTTRYGKFRLFQLTVRGANTLDSLITATERTSARKTGVII